MLDRDRAAALQPELAQISSTLYDAFGPQLASTIYAPNNQYRVLLEMLPKYQSTPTGCDMIYLKIGYRQPGAADAVAKLKTDAGPQSITHSGQLPSVTISFDLQAGHFAGRGRGRDSGRGQAQSAGHHHRQFQGTAKVFQDS